ncbi:MAG: hypothetical protein N0E41_08010 [Candidatus Thiodiazotropha taylori]|nr:hypothetical protein [Candidatus Thiodiazotropha taylori]
MQHLLMFGHIDYGTYDARDIVDFNLRVEGHLDRYLSIACTDQYGIKGKYLTVIA